MQFINLIATLGLASAVVANPISPRQDDLPTFDEWTCGNPSGGGGAGALRTVGDGFNRVFGGPLNTAAGQCYVATCGGHFFAHCNTSGETRTENSGTRDAAIGADPGNGGSCRYLGFRDTYSHYYFGVGDGTFGGNVDRRPC